MIKFFRKIRQRFLSENRFNKYLVYAIGEIVLVVIGILIALQINNWNEDRKSQQEELFYLENLKENLKQDTILLNTQLSNLKVKSDDLRRLSGELHKMPEDSINRILVRGLLSTSGFNSETATWENLQSTGNIDKIRKKSLVDSLFIYYNFNESRIRVWMESDQDYSRQNIAPFLMRNFELNYGVLSNEALLFDSRTPNSESIETRADKMLFRNALRYKNNAALMFTDLFKTQKNRAANILVMIDDALYGSTNK